MPKKGKNRPFQAKKASTFNFDYGKIVLRAYDNREVFIHEEALRPRPEVTGKPEISEPALDLSRLFELFLKKWTSHQK